MGGKNDDHLYIERREDGRYGVSWGGAQRSSAVETTQREAIDQAKKIDPNAPIHVERQRTTNKGKPDHWRKP